MNQQDHPGQANDFSAPEAANISAPSKNGNGDPVPRDLSELTGQTIGHFEIGERLGGGSLTAVYRARDRIMERSVALKLLLPGADEVTKERFRREARTMASLDHPYIVQTFQAGQTSTLGLIYIAMELVEGPTLADYLTTSGRLSSSDACALLRPVAKALAYAHDRGVVHRDVKPSNILLRRISSGSSQGIRLSGIDDLVMPVLSDFGIARALDAPELTSVGRTIGTPAFMAPEQCAGDTEIDGRADLYSLGAVLYRAIVGRSPFVGTTTQILHAHVYDPLMIPGEVLRELPAITVEILKRTLAKDADERYPSADLLADDLALAATEGCTPEYDEGNDDTRTLTIPVLARGGSAASETQVLIPGAAQYGSRPRPPTPAPNHVPRSTTIQPRAPMVARQNGQKRASPGNRVGAIVLGVAVVLLVLLFGISAATSLLPENLGLLRETGAENTVAPGFADQPEAVSTPQSGRDDARPDPSETDAIADIPAGSTVLPPDEEPRSTPPAIPLSGGIEAVATSAPTVTAAPPLEVSLVSAWDDAQAFFAEEDWNAALTWLIAVRRADETYRRAQVEEMLVTTYVELAMRLLVGGEVTQAVEYLREAEILQPNRRSLSRLRSAAASILIPAGEIEGTAYAELQAALVSYAQEEAADGDYCAAAQYVATAGRLHSGADLGSLADQFRQKCEDVEAERELAALSGALFYSSQTGDSYQIYQMQMGSEPASVLVIDNGAQPRVSPDGVTIAFHSLRQDMQGLVSFLLNSGMQPNDRAMRYSDYVEDAKDSPPSWNPQGDRLVYASLNFGDGRSRIYLTWADGSRKTETLGYGKDPAWHPSDDLIAFNGTDETGNRPGIWLMRPDGTARTQITDNGNDIRPIWAPDGRTIVFMSSGRDSNWEVYRVDITDPTLTVVRLTNHQAQDGLPTVSPDGEHVAFMTDRDGSWQVYYVPMAGGTSHLIGNIAGEMPKWLEHGIQWVK